ncbi:hypothetical protein [Natronobacterium gregoryi]|uniref:Uncharacterized protein n=2 Tax=Natronobacterium gregoryi TaxID=44930 RepID=L9XVE7_NATGS|nr:hypothetical protein [Natronobacterium gregoryi]ELY65814.1 hypothetical protein C490_13581 [Natronobacterium gregoryi SP2]PLK19444.1 hypothetical protein CYV19_14865 [Natronobacterium gregoryi SP2]SFJ48549.1 hypothetical protein SAMN05443661_13334 [Natronobacterium gregoryi]
MYNEEWEAIMTADSMEERVEEFAQLALQRAEESGGSVDDVVHEMTHDQYLLKHSTSDVLREIDELQQEYSDAFYDGDANDHVQSYLDDAGEFEFWHGWAYLSLAAGLEWAVLHELEQATA